MMRIYRKQIERIIIMIPMKDKEEIKKASDYCTDNGYKFVRSGPKPKGKYDYDFTKYRIVAEKEIKRKREK